MRVAQIIDSLRLAGGAERLQHSFAEAVADWDVDLTIITLRENDPEIVSALESLGARVVAFPSSRFVSPIRAGRVLRFLQQESFDVLHTHLVRATILGILAGRAAGIPTVATLHNTRRNHRLRSALLAAEALLLRHAANHVIAVGWETARVHRERLGGRHIDVIPNAVGEPCSLAPEERTALRHELGVGPDELLVMAVGRLHPQKAFPDLMRAIRMVAEGGQPVQLRIAGSGPLEAALRADAARLGVGRWVRFLGLRNDVPRLLAASDVYASSAAWEGLPVATLEAMAAGLPIVATEVGDVACVVDEASGALVPPGRPDALAQSLARVLADPELRLAQGKAARSRVQLHHGIEAWAGQLLAVYKQVCAESGGERTNQAEKDRRCASRW